jgi:hypothetical protein
MNECRRALALVALPDGIYAIGGYNGHSYLSSVEKYYTPLINIPIGTMSTNADGTL